MTLDELKHNNSRAIPESFPKKKDIDFQRQIGYLIEKIQKSRESGDLENARDFCLEWLRIEPDSERAGEILSIIDTALKQKHENLAAISRSRYLIQLKRYTEAMNLLNSLPDEGNHIEEARELRELIAAEIRRQKIEKKSIDVLDEISRLLDNGAYKEALHRLESNEIKDVNEKKILKRKIDTAMEIHQTEQDLKNRLLDSLIHNDLEKARVWLGMIVELNPASGVFDELKKKLAPEMYQTLTQGMTSA